MSEQEKRELLELMLKQYHIIKHIKRRCQNATPDDMDHINIAVKSYNQYVGIRRLKASACSIPQIVDLVGRLLTGMGLLNEGK